MHNLMQFTANTERRIQQSIAVARSGWATEIDPVELSLHTVAMAVQDLDKAVDTAISSARCQQLADRLAVELDLISQTYERARDKALALKQAGR